MEAATVKKKAISKGTIKKSIKNVLCRPDPVFWPVVTDEEAIQLKTMLEAHSIPLPEFKKMHWNELKTIPKSERPKPPKIKKVEGLIFGLSACRATVKSKTCSGFIIEDTVNPKAIVQPLIETCKTDNIPIVCLNGLKTSCNKYFGIPTTCLGIQHNNLPDLSSKINKIFNSKLKMDKVKDNIPAVHMQENNIKKELENDYLMQVDENTPCPYLYRTSKKQRIFISTNTNLKTDINKQFMGQNFIKLSDKIESESSSKPYMKMVLKRFSNNPNRIKKEK